MIHHAGPWKTHGQFIRSADGQFQIAQAFWPEQDAALLAAAPDLMAALRACADQLSIYRKKGHTGVERALAMAEHALSRAEGDSP